MTIGELFETKEELYLDVCNCYTDEIFPCICLPLEITQEGKEEFGIALKLDVEICDNEPGVYAAYILVQVKDDAQLKALRRFCYAQAGYIPEEDYDKWFQEDRSV